jgi:protein involved in temperature-dependent protein secretion
VEADPGDADAWMALLEATLVAEDHPGAAACLDALEPLVDPTWVAEQRLWLAAEAHRWEVMVAGRARPMVQGLVPPAGTDHRLAALGAWHAGEEEAVALILADAAAWPTSRGGAVDGASFSRLADGDAILAPFLEVLAPEVYLWLPLDDLQVLRMGERRTPLDDLWLPAEVVLRSGGAVLVRVPSRYAGSSRDPDDPVRRGLATRLEVVRGARRGAGRRVLLADAAEVDLATVREIAFAS